VLFNFFDMKHLTLIIYLFLFLQSVVSGQIEPEFKFKLYVEDFVGNLDSVILGYDSTVMGSNDYAQFGWKSLANTPFDSTLDIRGSFGKNSINDYPSKIYITHYRNWLCKNGWANYISINFYAKEFPIKLFWKSSNFEEECRDWTHFTRNYGLMFGAPGNGDRIQLIDQSELTITKEYLRQTETFNTSYTHEIEGGRIDTVYVMFLGFAGEYPRNVSVSEPDILPIKIYPNPTNSKLRIEMKDKIHGNAEIEIRNSIGKLEYQYSLPRGTQQVVLNIDQLKKGIYHILLRSKGEIISKAKFVKGE